MSSDPNEAALLTPEDIDDIVEAIEHFVIGPTDDAELEAIWRPYIKKLEGVRDLVTKLRLVEQERDGLKEAVGSGKFDCRVLEAAMQIDVEKRRADAAEATIAACRALPVHHGIMLPDVPDGGPQTYSSHAMVKWADLKRVLNGAK